MNRVYLLDFDALFGRYIQNEDFEQKSANASLGMISKHTVIERWPYRLKKQPGEEGAQEDFKLLPSSGLTGWERQVEWERIWLSAGEWRLSEIRCALSVQHL